MPIERELSSGLCLTDDDFWVSKCPDTWDTIRINFRCKLQKQSSLRLGLLYVIAGLESLYTHSRSNNVDNGVSWPWSWHRWYDFEIKSCMVENIVCHKWVFFFFCVCIGHSKYSVSRPPPASLYSPTKMFQYSVYSSSYFYRPSKCGYFPG